MFLYYSYCHVSIMPLRKAPSHRSEQVSQLLFGEKAEVLQVENDWAKIRCKHDEYEGYCSVSQLTKISKKEYAKVAKYIAANGALQLVSDNGAFVLPQGAELQKSTLEIVNETFKLKGKKQKISELHFDAERLKIVAFQFLYAPYQWGGRSLWGIDCSGFSQLVFKLCGKNIQRDASQQALEGEVIDFLQHAQIGDLAFFDNEEGKINHVGILLDNETIIHATEKAGEVVIDKIDQGGIISKRLRQRTHNLRLVKRYFH